MNGQQRKGRYRFDEFTLELGRETLRNAAGQELPLRPKSLALLLYMLAHPGRLLARDELLNVLWPTVAVSDDSLTQCVSDLRHAFGLRSTHIIRTVPRRGYTLIAAVEHSEAVPGPDPQPASWSERSAPITVGWIARPDTEQHDPTTRHLLETLATDLAAELASFEDLRVVPAGSTAAAQAFRATFDVRPSGAGRRVSLRLDSADGALLWAERCEMPPGPAAELDVAQLGRLAINIMRHANREHLREARARPVELLTTRQLCLLGQDLHRRGTEADTRAAVAMLDRAVKRDPTFALAQAWLSYTIQRSVTHGWGDMEPKAARQYCLALAQSAVHLEPGSAPCLARLAFALLLHERWEEAVATARAAVRCCRWATWEALSPAGEVLVYSGNAAEAVLLLREMLAQDSLCPPTARAVLGRALLLAGEPEQALPELQWCAAQLPDYSPCLNSLVVAAIETGRLAEAKTALQEVRRIEAMWPAQSPNGRWLLRHERDRARFTAAFLAAAAL